MLMALVHTGYLHVAIGAGGTKGVAGGQMKQVNIVDVAASRKGTDVGASATMPPADMSPCGARKRVDSCWNCGGTGNR